MSAALWGAVCDRCEVKTTIDGDGQSVADPGEWEEFPTCLVCGATLYFDSFDETQWERETRLMRVAVERQNGGDA